MIRTLFGTFTLFYVLLLVFRADCFLLRVDLATTTEQAETERDIMAMRKYLMGYPGIRFLFTGKTNTNRHFLMVLEVHNIYWRSFLMSKLSAQGRHITAAPLQSCREYAKEIGANVDYISTSDIQEEIKISYVEATVYDKGTTTLEYFKLLVKFFQREDTLVMGKQHRYVCYQSYSDLSVKLLFLTAFLSQNDAQELHKITSAYSKMSIDLRLFENFASTRYGLKCSNRN